MSEKPIPVQIEPSIDPHTPITSEVHSYYILEEPNSPSVAPPNAIRKVQYKRRQFLHDDPDDFRRPYGYVDYENELSFEEIDKYNLLPFDRTQILLYDLWQSFGKDKPRMLKFFEYFFKAVLGDTDGHRMKSATKLSELNWTITDARKAIKKI